MTIKVNLNGINELDFPSGVSSATTDNGVTTVNLSGGGGSSSEHVNAQTGVTYTIQTTDSGYLVTFTNSSSVAVTLPQAGASYPDGFFVDVVNEGTGTVTITPTTSTIDNLSDIALTQYEGMRIVSDGTNYYTVRGLSAGATGTAGGDLSGNYPDPTVAQVNGAAVPASADVVGTNGSKQLVSASSAQIQAAIGASVYDAYGAASTAQTNAETYASDASNLASGTVATARLPADNTVRTLGITIDGGGSIPLTGVKGYLTVPWAGTITSWTCIADQSGSCAVDINYISGSGAPPTAPNIPTNPTNLISASAPVGLSSEQSAAGGSAAISTWTPALAQWGTLMFELNSVSTCTRITVQLQFQLG